MVCRPNTITTAPAIFDSRRSRSSRNWPSALAAAPREMNTNEKPRMKKIDAIRTRRRDAATDRAAALPVPCISSRLTPEM